MANCETIRDDLINLSAKSGFSDRTSIGGRRHARLLVSGGFSDPVYY
jgi:hypothetical protein